MKSNYIYLINVKDTNKYKIGISSSPRQRLKTISRHIPFEIFFHKLYEVNNVPVYVERKLHTHFNQKRITGEWFELNSDDLSLIDNMIKQFDSETPTPRRQQLSSGKHYPYHEPIKDILIKYKRIEDEYKNNTEKRKLIKNGGSIRNLVAHKLGMSSGTLGRLRAIEQKQPHLLELIDTKEMTVNEAYQLTF